MSAIGGRIVYTILFFVFSFLAWVFRNWSKQILSFIPVLKKCTEEPETTDQIVCYGTLAVYRITFVLAVFHAFLALLTIGVKRRGDCRVSLQDGWWGIKVILIIGAIVGAFFIPNPFFEYYGWVALVASGIFIVVQLVLLVDFAHTWAENWIGKLENAEDGDSKWWWVLLIATIILYIFSLAVTITMGVFFAKDAGSCARNVAFLLINGIICLLFSLASIHPKVQEASPKSGLLQSAFITAYSTYLIASALMSDTGKCNPLQSSAGANNASILVGALFTIIAVCYTTIRAASQVGGTSEEKTPLNKEEKAEEEKTEDKDSKEEENVDLDEPVTYNFSRFHIIFALGALYIAMLMSDWRVVYHPGETTAQVDSGLASVWVKVVSSWICGLLYVWTLLGPVILPDRDWN